MRNRLCSPFFSEIVQAINAAQIIGIIYVEENTVVLHVKMAGRALYLAITFACGVSMTALFSSNPVSRILWPTIAAINEAFVIGLRGTTSNVR